MLISIARVDNKMENKILYRNADIQTTAEQTEKLSVEGYAIIFNSPAPICKDENGRIMYEVIENTAFDSLTNIENTVMRYNHNDDNLILARTSNNTLVLSKDEKGVFIRAELAQTTQGKDIFELIKRKDISKMSFGYLPDEIDFDYNTNTLIIKHIARLVDVSAVDVPAYSDTSIAVSYRNEQKAKIDKLLLEQKQKAEQEQLKTKIQILLNM